MSAYDEYVDYLLDVEDVRQAYQEAFRNIAFSENYGIYSNDMPLIENRAPGSPISASVWNTTINELRDVCSTVARSMAAYNRGINDAFQIFVDKINAMMLHFLDEEYTDFINWLINARFSAGFEYGDNIEGSNVPKSCYLHLCIGDESDPNRIDVRSDNLMTPQYIWDVAVEPNEPVDDHGQPIWRIKIDSSAETVDASFATMSDIARAIETFYNDSIINTFATNADNDSAHDAFNQHFTQLETFVGYAATGVETLPVQLQEIKDQIGTKPSDFEDSPNLWTAIKDVKDAQVITEAEKTDLLELIDAKEGLLGLTDDVTTIKEILPPTQESLIDVVDAYNETILRLQNACAVVEACTCPKNCSTESSGLGRRLIKTAHPLPNDPDFMLYSQEDYQVPKLTYIGDTSQQAYALNQIRSNLSSVYINVNNGTAWIHGTIRTGGSSQVCGNTGSGHYCWPILELPDGFTPATTAFDNYLRTVTSSGYSACMQILVRPSTGSDSYYYTNKASKQSYQTAPGKHVLALTHYSAPGSSTPAKLTSGVAIHFDGAYNTNGQLRDLQGNEMVTRTDFNTPAVKSVTHLPPEPVEFIEHAEEEVEENEGGEE